MLLLREGTLVEDEGDLAEGHVEDLGERQVVEQDQQASQRQFDAGLDLDHCL